MGNNKMMVTVVTAISMVFFICNFSFAASTINSPTVKYINNKTVDSGDAVAINDIILTETVISSFNSVNGGQFTIKIPADLNICNIGSNTTQDTSITSSTTILGSSTYPKALYVLGAGFSASGSPTIYFSSGSENYSILNVSILADGSVGFGIPSGPDYYASLANFSNPANPAPIISAGEVGTVKVGEIYYNATTQETVITLAAKGNSGSYLEKICISGLKLMPANTTGTGDQDITFSDGNAAGTANLFGISGSSLKVIKLVSQSIVVSGTVSPATVPLITEGKVAAQPMGVVQLTFVGEPENNSSSTITFSLDNGAKFHSDADYPISYGFVTNGLTTSQVDGDFFVNSSGNLVWTIANPQNEIDSNNTFQFNAASKMIDTSSITSDGTITCTIIGAGAFSGDSGTVKVATVFLSGTIVSFIDNNSPGVPTLYAGTDNQEFGSGEYVLVGEKAPGSLLQGGTIKVELSNGAKFHAFSTGPIVDYTDTIYQNTSFSIGSVSNFNSSSSLTFTLNQASSGTLGAFTVGLNASNWLDLTNATAGDLTMTFSGTAGATGTVKIATIINSTSSKTWYQDFDGDGYGNSTKSLTSTTQPSGYVLDNTDCNDNDATIHPGATEIAGDNIDQDCNGTDLTLSNTWYYDSDGDGYGDLSNSLTSATKPNGYVSDKTDCNDNDATVHPNAAEIAGDGIDQDCNGSDAVNTGIWYYDSDGDGYGDPNDSLAVSAQPKGYVSDNTDCDDTDATINPGATEIAGDGIDQDCNGSDLAGSTQVEQISLLAPTDNETISFGTSGGKATFSFSKLANAAKYILHLDLNDILNDISFAIPVELIPPGVASNDPWGGTTSSTPGFSETFIGMVYELALDTATWDVLALYDIKWGVEAYDSAGSLIGSSFEGSVATKYINSLKFIASNSIAMTNPTLGEELSLTGSAPAFKWDAYQGVSTYALILAHMGSLGFDSVITKDNLTLNLFPMSDSTWQSMPTGTWYWTVLGYNSTGNQAPLSFTIFDFEVQ